VQPDHENGREIHVGDNPWRDASGLRQFELWTGLKFPTSLCRRAVDGESNGIKHYYVDWKIMLDV
jgi:hypothetical protein